MVELKIRCPDADLLKRLISERVTERMSSLEASIGRTEERLREFESKYQLPTDDFLRRFADDEIQHSLDFDEWIGESRMLAHLLAQKSQIQGIEFVN